MDLWQVLLSELVILFIHLCGIYLRVQELQKIEKLSLIILKGCPYRKSVASFVVRGRVSQTKVLTCQKNLERKFHVL
jgi:hypothetical protein